MNFFVFSDTGIQMSNNFWLYWAITIPLTIAVLTLWKIWTCFQYRPMEEKLKTDEVEKLFVEEKDPIHGDGESPFYLFVPR
jgi:hypothetical protein